MSRKNSRKELLGVYKSCLSALNVYYRPHYPDIAACRKKAEEDYEAAHPDEARQAAKAAHADKAEQAAKARKKEGEIVKSTLDLYNVRMLSCFKDPNRAAKGRIEQLMAQAG